MIKLFGQYVFIETIGRITLWSVLALCAIWVNIEMPGQGTWYERTLGGILIGLPVGMIVSTIVEVSLEGRSKD